MFDIGSSELLLIIVVAIVVIGPKDLPRALYKLGQVVGKAKGMARHFRTGVDAMIREAELEELQKQWAKENERIMASTRIPEFDTTAEPVVDETAQLPAPEADWAADEAGPENGPETPPPATDPAADPDQPGLPLETPRGTSAA
jgi:sec-independent protein translocase protein TatB